MKAINYPIMSIDIGRKRVGLAIIFSSASRVADYKTILSRESKKAETAILNLIKEKAVATLVAGLPLDAKNNKTEQCEDVERFCKRIQNGTSVNLIYIDEYLTSVEAMENSKRSKGQAVDDLAAEIILNRFLSLHNA